MCTYSQSKLIEQRLFLLFEDKMADVFVNFVVEMGFSNMQQL
jgi:hypothetical protein